MVNGFWLDMGWISVLCIVGGVGVCLDGSINLGVEISLYFDFMLVKLICWGCDFFIVVSCVCWVIVEFWICGVLMNILFL